MAEFVEKGIDAWNVAQGYTHLKILKQLIECDKLVMMALYGTESIEQSLEIPEQLKTMLRIEAINRLIDTIRLLIENSMFCLVGKTKADMESIEKRVKDVCEVITGISRKEIDQRNGSSKIVINELHFRKCLEELRSIKQIINEPLNKASLIFPASDEVDLDKMKQQLIDGG